GAQRGLRRGERQRPLEQVAASGNIAAAARPPPSIVQVLGGPARRLGVAVSSELARVTHRLLQMPAGDLIELCQAATGLLEPVGEPLVTLSAGGLRQPVI